MSQPALASIYLTIGALVCLMCGVSGRYHKPDDLDPFVSLVVIFAWPLGIPYCIYQLGQYLGKRFVKK